VARSRCLQCDVKLTWIELVPIVSFVGLRGKCQSCGGRIPGTYITTEVLSAGMFLASFIIYGLSPMFLWSSSFLLVMVLAAVIDWKHFVIPNSIVIVGWCVGVVLVYGMEEFSLSERLLSSIGGIATMVGIYLLGNLIFRRESMGVGDIKLAGLIALFLGFVPFLISLWLAAVIGSLYGLLRPRVSFLNRLASNSPSGIPADAIPFGSFLALSAGAVCLFSESIWEVFNLFVGI